MLAALVTLALAASGATASRIKWGASVGPSAGYLAVTGGDLVNGAKAHTSTNARILVYTDWDYIIGEETSFKLSQPDTNLCLDAGLQQYNGSPVKIWECLGDVPQQKWIVDNDGYFRLAGTQWCVDVKEGQVASDQLQLWQCAQGNPNQIWHTAFALN